MRAKPFRKETEGALWFVGDGALVVVEVEARGIVHAANVHHEHLLGVEFFLSGIAAFDRGVMRNAECVGDCARHDVVHVRKASVHNDKPHCGQTLRRIHLRSRP